MANMSLDQFIHHLDKVSDEAIAAATEALNENAEDLLYVSGNLTPVDQGDLTASGSVEPAKNEGNRIVARVGYSKEYALAMHEGIYELGEQSKQKPDFDGMKVGRKFLFRPLQKYNQKYTDHIANKVNEVL